MSGWSSRNLIARRSSWAVPLALALALALLASLAPVSASVASSDYRLRVFHDTSVKGMGARIAGPGDVHRLKGTPHGFRKYVGAEGQRAATHTTTCDVADAAVYVRAYTSNHFAAGAGSPCGGHWGNARVILGKRHHKWKVLIATQDAWDCRLLERFQVPARLIKAAPAPADARHNCYDSTTQKPGHYPAGRYPITR